MVIAIFPYTGDNASANYQITKQKGLIGTSNKNNKDLNKRQEAFILYQKDSQYVFEYLGYITGEVSLADNQHWPNFECKHVYKFQPQARDVIIDLKDLCQYLGIEKELDFLITRKSAIFDKYQSDFCKYMWERFNIAIEANVSDDSSSCSSNSSSTKSKPQKQIKKKEDKRKTISKAKRASTWNKYIGNNVGETKCPLCQDRTITQGLNDWEASHVISVSNSGTNDISNLRVLCSQCNQSMSKKNMIDYIEDNFDDISDVKRRLKLSTNTDLNGKTTTTDKISPCRNNSPKTNPIRIEQSYNGNDTKYLELEIWRESDGNTPLESSRISAKITNQSDIDSFIKWYRNVGNSSIIYANLSESLWEKITQIWNSSFDAFKGASYGRSEGNKVVYCYTVIRYKIVKEVY